MPEVEKAVADQLVEGGVNGRRADGPEDVGDAVFGDVEFEDFVVKKALSAQVAEPERRRQADDPEQHPA